MGIIMSISESKGNLISSVLMYIPPSDRFIMVPSYWLSQQKNLTLIFAGILSKDLLCIGSCAFQVFKQHFRESSYKPANMLPGYFLYALTLERVKKLPITGNNDLQVSANFLVKEYWYCWSIPVVSWYSRGVHASGFWLSEYSLYSFEYKLKSELEWIPSLFNWVWISFLVSFAITYSWKKWVY